jgi:hypothetical protein
VPPPQTVRFQERLRYIICTSQLLSEKITPSLYPDNASDDPLDLYSKRKLRYWVGSGGCVIVVALLISWTSRVEGESRELKARNLAALAMGLLIAVYLYAHTVWLLSSQSLIAATTIHPTSPIKGLECHGDFSSK